ncbi:MAG: hypothetical protein WC453_03750 [Patescibacteria group bacterium]
MYWIIGVTIVLLAVVRPTLLVALFNYIRRAVQDVTGILLPILPVYAIGTLAVIIWLTVLIILGALINSPVITGICFLLSILLFYLVFLIPGFVLKIIGVNERIFPLAVRTAAAWLAFFGFLGMLYSDILNIEFLIALSLLGFISLGVASKANFLKSVIYPLVIVMCVIAVWKYAAPDNFRAITRNISATGKQINSSADRNSLGKEADAAVTYAYLNRSVSVVYTAVINQDDDGNDYIASLQDVTKHISDTVMVKVYNHKDEVLTYQGQGFVMIQAPKTNGSFVNATQYWIEADYLSFLSPTDLAAEREQKNRSKRNETVLASQNITTPAVTSPIPKFYDAIGTYPLGVGKGEQTGWINVGPCHRYNFSSNSITLKYKDRDSVNVWEIKKLPDVSTFRLINRGDGPVNLLVKS